MGWKTWGGAMLAAALVAGTAPQACALTGVSAWAEVEVSRAETAGLVPDTFDRLAAQEDVSRAEFCNVILRLFEEATGRMAELQTDSPFADTDDPIVVSASALGLVSGRGDGTFDPDATITRQELCVMLGNVLRQMPGDPGQADVDALRAYADAGVVAAWAQNDVAAMVDSGVISGITQGDGSITLSPEDTTTREQSLILAVRFLSAYALEEAPGNDSEAPPAIADDLVAQMPAGEDSVQTAPAPDNGSQTGSTTDGTPILPEEAGSLTEEQKLARVFGSATPGYDSPEQAEAAMADITVPVWRLQSDGTKTADTMTLTVNANLAQVYQAVFEEIFAGEEQFPLKNGGSYAWRSNARSEHRWGTAVDLNWEENMECYIDASGAVTQITTGTHWTPGEDPYSIPADGDVVRAFKKYGFAWGGDAWPSKRDYMHFSYFGR